MHTSIYTVNTPQPYHNCELIFSYHYENPANGFKVDDQQLYHIHTTMKEVYILNEVLEIFQAPGYKEQFIDYNNVTDGSNVYPAFVIDYIDGVQMGKQLRALAKDDDGLVQINDFCLETPPTYEDDFKINKTLHELKIGDETYHIDDYEDFKEYLDELRESRAELFQ
jgi:hypothetical protein